MKNVHPLAVALLSLLFFLLSFHPASAQWEKKRLPGKESIQTLRKIGNSFLALTTNIIYRSDDLGWTWEEKLSLPTNSTDIAFFGDRIYRQANIDSIFYSDDKCESWQFLTKKPDSNAGRIVADSQYLFVSLSNGKLWRFDLSQHTWTQLTAGQYSNFFLQYIENGRLWCRHWQGLVYSPDYGNTWLPAISGAIKSLCVAGDSVFVATQDIVFRSFDGGSSWDSFVTDQFAYSPGVKHFDNGMLVRFSTPVIGNPAISLDWGHSWQVLPMPYINDIIFDGTDMIVASYKGFMRSSDGGTTWFIYNNGFKASGIINDNSDRTLSNIGENLIYQYYNWSADEGEHWVGSLDPQVQPVLAYQDKMLGLYDNGDSIVLMRSNIGDFMGWERIFANGGPSDFKTQFVIKGDTIFCLGDIKADPWNFISMNVVFCSTDGGTNWQQLTTTGFVKPEEDLVVHNGKLFIGTRDEIIMMSADGGVNWAPVNLGLFPQAGLKGKMRLISTEHFLFAYTYAWPILPSSLLQYDIYGSDDGGLTWKHLDFPLDMTNPTQNLLQNSYKLIEAVVDPVTENIYVISNQNKIYRSNGVSMNWTAISTDTINHTLDRLHFLNNKLYYSAFSALWQMDAGTMQHISGTAFRDINNNGVHDVGELGLKDAVFKFRGTGEHFEAFDNGDFQYYTYYGIDTLNILKPNKYAIMTPPYHALSGVDTSLQFAVYYPPNITDLMINANTSAFFRPGFYGEFGVSVKNLGTEAASGTLKAYLPNLITPINLPAGSTILGDTIVIPFASLPADSSLSWQIGGTLPADVQLLGDTLTAYFVAETSAQDSAFGDNASVVSTIIVGSYDPNDKHAKGEPFYPYSNLSLNEPIYYSIRFQNTGSFPATNVKIIDNLEANLESTSFQFIGSSHPCAWSINGKGELIFDFPNINLPDSVHYEKESHGFIYFSIMPKHGILPNDLISNKATIYFDNNPPVITNEVVLTVSDQTGSTDDDHDGYLNSEEDTDGDGIINNDDSDMDGVPDYLDPDPFVFLDIKAFLQGAYDPNFNLMQDSLRSKGYLPLSEPYSQLQPYAGYIPFKHIEGGGEIVQPEIFETTGSDAIVDWVFVELRSKNDPKKTLLTKSLLLQRDGDVVDLNGATPVFFKINEDSFFVSLRHRNHLGVMTSQPILLTRNKVLPASIDFTEPATGTYGTYSQKTIGNRRALWGGNVDANNFIVFQGSGADRDFVFFTVFTDSGNISGSFNYISHGYLNSDTDMDGNVAYQGLGNDVDKFIFFNVLLHPLNTTSVINFYITQQLP